MAAELTVYESQDFGRIRVTVVDGEILVVADDFAKCLGYREARDLIRSLDPDEFAPHTVRGKRGDREANCLTEAGVYHAILMRKAACVRDPEARAMVEAFQHWVYHEVLPSIRKSGYYVNPMFAPTREERMAIALVDAHEALAELRAESDRMRPMAALGEAVSASDTSIQICDMARILQQNGCPWAGRNRFYRRLREDGYLGSERTGMKNRPMQRYVDQGLFEVSESTFTKRDGSVGIHVMTYVTPKGQRHLLEKYAGVDTWES